MTGRLASVQYPNGQTSAYTYLSNAQDHRLQTIHHRYPNTATLSKFDYTYDTVGNILTWRQQADSTAVTWEYGYDRADQLTAAIKRATDPQGTILKRYYYRYDPAGNRLSEQIDDAVISWTYDNLNRLVTQTPGGWLKVRGQLDEYANVTINAKPANVSATNAFDGSAQVGAGTTAFTITAADVTGNPSSRAFEVDTAGMPRAFTFDANGNLTSDGTRTFEWDVRDQLVAINGGTHRTELAYDGDNRRVRIVEKENYSVVGTQWFAWDWNEIAERRDASGAVVTARVYRHGLQENGAARNLTRDHLLSIREMTDAATSVQARYEYAPFGTVTKVTGSTPDFSGFTDVLLHEPSGLLLMKRRAYDTALARWLSEDPLGRQGGPNLYAYVLNQPLRWIDPEGTVPIKPLAWQPNGNITSTFRRQNDWPVCDVPAILGWEARSCVTQCCKVHDDCFEQSRCNWTSWLTIMFDSACTRCNLAAALCINAAIRLPPSACEPCKTS